MEGASGKRDWTNKKLRVNKQTKESPKITTYPTYYILVRKTKCYFVNFRGLKSFNNNKQQFIKCLLGARLWLWTNSESRRRSS